jgi:competence protein ComEC
LGIVAVLYACGLLLADYFPLPLSCLIAISLALTAAALLVPRPRLHLVRLLFVFVGWTNLAWHTAIISPTDLRVILTNEPQLATLRGTLAETPQQRIYLTDEGETLRTMARLNVTAILGAPAPVPPKPSEGGSRRQVTNDWQPASGQIMVITPGELPQKFCERQEVQIYGVISPPPLPIAEGLFDYRTYLRRQEIYFQLKTQSSNDWQSIGMNASPPVRDRFAKWAKAALAIGRTNIDTPLRLEQSLTLGDKSFLTDDVAEPFMQAATYHIFAVDGLRMAILFGIFFKALRWLRVSRTISGFILIPLLWAYVELTGWPASAIRAAVMLTIVIGGWMLQRPVDVLNSLFAAALIILVWQPQQLFQAGFQLSFCVVFCIFLVMPRFDNFVQRLLKSDPMLPDQLRPRWQINLLKPVRYILDLFFSSLAAWLGSIPLAAYYFHMLTPVSTPANVIAVPLCGLVLICNSLSLLLAAWLPIGATIFNFLGWHFMHWIHVSSIWFAQWPHAFCYIPAPNLFTIVLYYAIFIALATGWLLKPEWPKWKFTALILLSIIWGGQFLHYHSQTHLIVLPLNGGSAIYFDAPGNRDDLLVDCGNEDSVNFVMKPYLRAQGVNSLRAVALTVGDIQQVGGFGKLQSLTPITKVITSPVRFRSPIYRDILQSLAATPDRHQEVASDNTFWLWTVLYPTSTNNFPRADDNALVLRGDIQGTRILSLSTLGRIGQEVLFERHLDLHADIVIAGLPGQSEPLNDALLEAIHPALIIIADSQSPAPRHANRPLRDRLAKRGIPILYTSDLGAVKISMQKNHWKAETVNGSSWTAVTDRGSATRIGFAPAERKNDP